MDRLKFRVWDTTKDKYIESYYNHNYYMDLQSNEVCMVVHDDCSELGESREHLQGNKIIIEQCTGLKDKNGVLIYENDLVAFTDSQGMQRFHIIKYDSSLCGYVALLDINKDDDISFACRADEKWLLRKEVIGNIHQNKELLGE